MDVHSYSRGQRVWKWWVETALYKLEPNWFDSSRELPTEAPEGTKIYIMGETARSDYVRRAGEWKKVREITQEDCMRIYEGE